MKNLFVASVAIFLIAFASKAVASSRRYDGYKVYKVFVHNADQLEEFKKLADNLQIRYLTEIGAVGQYYDVAVEPKEQTEFESRMLFYKFDYKTMIPDLQKVLRRGRSVSTQQLEWTQYHSLDDIYNWLDWLIATYPRIIEGITIGKSFENREIRGVKMSHKKGNKAIFLQSNIHAIEWISSAAGTCFFNKMVTSDDKELRHLAMDYDWIFLPILNPDGYVYTHEVERLWRKNRRPNGFSNSSGLCYGTDLNRNFNYEWGMSGWNLNMACDHWYAGTGPATEPEVQAMQKFTDGISTDYLRMYVSLHSYGNLVILPYGHSPELPENYDQMMRISKGFADGARKKYGTNFLYGSTNALLYPLSGAGKDYAYGVNKIPYSATLELRDSGEYGFFLPAEQIIEVCEEITDGFISMIKAAEDENLFRNNVARASTSLLILFLVYVVNNLIS